MDLKSVYEQLIEVMNDDEMSNHQSDLYVLKNGNSTPIVEQYKKEFPVCVTTFISNIDRKIWYDIAFAYQPYWNKRIKS